MYPVVYEFLGFNIYGYGLMIGIGIICGVMYLATNAKKELNLSYDYSNNLLIYLVIASVIGGKIFLFFEAPALYFKNPLALISGSGFVFYGSLIFCYGVLFWFSKKYNVEPKPFMDLIAITTCIVQVFGRIGCYLAGCCYGKPTGSNYGIAFTNPLSSAQPLKCLLHPTQLYESAGMAIILLVLVITKKYRKFKGQIFCLYLILYPILRFNIEFLRADSDRGFLFNNAMSNSQFVSLILFVIGIILYVKWTNDNNKILNVLIDNNQTTS